MASTTCFSSSVKHLNVMLLVLVVLFLLASPFASTSTSTFGVNCLKIQVRTGFSLSATSQMEENKTEQKQKAVDVKLEAQISRLSAEIKDLEEENKWLNKLAKKLRQGAVWETRVDECPSFNKSKSSKKLEELKKKLKSGKTTGKQKKSLVQQLLSLNDANIKKMKLTLVELQMKLKLAQVEQLEQQNDQLQKDKLFFVSSKGKLDKKIELIKQSPSKGAIKKLDSKFLEKAQETLGNKTYETFQWLWNSYSNKKFNSKKKQEEDRESFINFVNGAIDTKQAKISKNQKQLDQLNIDIASLTTIKLKVKIKEAAAQTLIKEIEDLLLEQQNSHYDAGIEQQIFEKLKILEYNDVDAFRDLTEQFEDQKYDYYGYDDKYGKRRIETLESKKRKSQTIENMLGQIEEMESESDGGNTKINFSPAFDEQQNFGPLEGEKSLVRLLLDDSLPVEILQQEIAKITKTANIAEKEDPLGAEFKFILEVRAVFESQLKLVKAVFESQQELVKTKSSKNQQIGIDWNFSGVQQQINDLRMRPENQKLEGASQNLSEFLDDLMTQYEQFSDPSRKFINFNKINDSVTDFIYQRIDQRGEWLYYVNNGILEVVKEFLKDLEKNNDNDQELLVVEELENAVVLVRDEKRKKLNMIISPNISKKRRFQVASMFSNLPLLKEKLVERMVEKGCFI